MAPLLYKLATMLLQFHRHNSVRIFYHHHDTHDMTYLPTLKKEPA